MVFKSDINNRFAGLRLDAYLAQKFPYHARNVWQRKIREGAILLNGKKAKPSTEIPRDSAVAYDFGDFKEFPVRTDYSVLLDDEWLFIVDKPGDIPVHTSGKYFNNTLIKLLRKEHPGYNLNLVNRLDRETSGIIVLGKTTGACKAMSLMFMEKRLKKTYIAYTFGQIEKDEFRVDAPIAEEVSGVIRIRMGVNEKGAAARTDFKVIKRKNGYTKLYCYPLTGRTNQIRVHLSHIGHPIVGDKLYSGNDEDFLGFVGKGNTPEILGRVILPRQALHAHKLLFTHPFLKEAVEITAPEPEDMLGFEQAYMDNAGPTAG